MRSGTATVLVAATGARTTYGAIAARIGGADVEITTYRADTLRRWWTDVATELTAAPRNADERDELEKLLREEAEPVLRVLRSETEALLLRVRIVADAVRARRRADQIADVSTPPS